jgi:acetolactate synthase-1/2/3 large subunit
MLGSLGASALLPAAPVPASPLDLPFRRGPGVRGRMTGAKAMAAALACEGTRCVFGIPGAQNNEFWDAMKSQGIPYLLVTHELAASVMADGAARATGEVGVFSVVPGPGLTNALTGLGEAKLDSVPIVGLVTDVAQGPQAHAFQVHSLPGAELLRPISKEVIVVRHQCEIADAVFRAFSTARSGEPGPVAVVIPYNLLTESWDYNSTMTAAFAPPFDEAEYRRAVGLLADRSRRIGIYAGLGCMDASDSLVSVAELLQAPVATSVSGKGCFPAGHPLSVGWGYGPQGTRAAEYAFREVDTLLAIGVRYSEVSTANYSIPVHDPLVHVDINPENLGRNVHACVKLCADSRMFLDRLVADGAALRREPCAGLAQRLHAYRQIDCCENEQIRIACDVDPMHFLVKLRQAMGADDLFYVDVTASTHWAAEAFGVEKPRRYFAPADNQSMGWAIPAAIGAQQVFRDRRVVALSGDGCFLMSAMEMSTAARAGLPVKFFVLDDGTFHYMQMLQKPAYRRTTATELARLDYAAFASAVGLKYNEITTNDDVPAGIGRAFAEPRPVLTRLAVSYEGRQIRWLESVKASYLDSLSTRQKVRMASRVGVRTLNRHPEND